ncbi:ENDOV [Blepharisma stoltei]|uniref:Endonuclease V n=1 Tax=Blepharisma stoltei TaxID=1481888 RepID=A0AAU9J2N5_9CILI|nr:unnamed protein product [Blepharisma stoltei]
MEGKKKSKYKDLIDQVDPLLLEQWSQEQFRLKAELREENCFDWNLDTLELIGGVDISADKHDQNKAVACLIVCRYPSFEIVHEQAEEVTLTQPYVPGYLAFREVEHLERLINDSPVKPQLILVDGNGILHNKGFGLASHLGVIVRIPTVGVGKHVFAVDGITAYNVKQLSRTLQAGGEHVNLVGKSGKIWGAALRSTDDCINPVIVSVGNMITLPTALEIVKQCCLYRVPEPIRLADKLSRKMVKNV